VVAKNQGLHFSEAKRPGREASSSSEIENECHYTNSSSYNFRACRGTNSLLHVIIISNSVIIRISHPIQKEEKYLNVRDGVGQKSPESNWEVN